MEDSKQIFEKKLKSGCINNFKISLVYYNLGKLCLETSQFEKCDAYL